MEINMTTKVSEELNDYFKNFVPMVKKRAYDGRFNVWFPLLNVKEDSSWSLDWEIRGVHDTFELAMTDLKKRAA
jgi:hypothetical protein